MSEKEVRNKSSKNIQKVDSKKICEELKNILKKAKLNSFIELEQNEKETIYQKSKKLSFQEKASLLKIILTYPGTHLYDAAGLFETTIRVDDQHSRASQNRPLAYIESTDGYNSRVEVIDILESVRNDATLIGHPAILSAIHHWQKILSWEKYSKDNDIYSEEKIHQKSNYLLSGKYVKSARRNLEAIGKALLEGSKRQAVSKESSLAFKIKDLNLDVVVKTLSDS